MRPNQSPGNTSPHRSQVDTLNVDLPERFSTVIPGRREAGGCGDVQRADRDNTESQAVELSEEGLSHIMASYTQPVAAAAALTPPATGGMNTSKDMFGSELASQMDWVSYYLSTVKSSQQGCFEEAGLFNQDSLLSNMLTSNHGLCKTASKSIMKEDKTQASSTGALNTSSFHSKNPFSNINESAKKTLTGKTRAPRASSSNDTRKPESLKPHANSSFTSRRSAHCSRSKSRTGKGNSAIVNQTSKLEQCKRDNSRDLKNSLLQSSQCTSPQIYSKFNVNSASNLANVSSRGSGVKNESHLQKSPSGVLVSQIVNTRPCRRMSMAERLSRSKGDSKPEFTETLKLPDSNSHTCQPKQPYFSYVTGKVQQDAGHETVPCASYLSDPKFSVVANPGTFFDRENISSSKDHSLKDHPWPSVSHEDGVSNNTDFTQVQGKNTQEQEILYPGHQWINGANFQGRETQEPDNLYRNQQCIRQHGSNFQGRNTQEQDTLHLNQQYIRQYGSSVQGRNTQEPDILHPDQQCINGPNVQGRITQEPEILCPEQQSINGSNVQGRNTKEQDILPPDHQYFNGSNVQGRNTQEQDTPNPNQQCIRQHGSSVQGKNTKEPDILYPDRQCINGSNVQGRNTQEQDFLHLNQQCINGSSVQGRNTQEQDILHSHHYINGSSVQGRNTQEQDILNPNQQCIRQHGSSVNGKNTQEQYILYPDRQCINGSSVHGRNTQEQDIFHPNDKCINESSVQVRNKQEQDIFHPDNQFIDGTNVPCRNTQEQEILYPNQQCISRSSVQGSNTQEPDICHPVSDHHCVRQHQSSDSQQFSYHSTPPVLTQNISPCVSEWSNYSYNKDTFSWHDDSGSAPGIKLYPCEDNQLNTDSPVEDTMHNHQHMLYIEASSPVRDQTDLRHYSELHVTPSFEASASLFMGANHNSDMSDILEHFPSFTSKMFEEKPVKTICRSSVAGEIRYFYNCLEKERLRRKHCEEHILKQDAKLLEVQQQLAVALSTGRRKDVMVEQLDKQLAKFVEGWKKKEAEKDEHIRVLKLKKLKWEQTLQSQHAMIRDLEQELSDKVEDLKKEKTSSEQAIEGLKNEICQVHKDLTLAEQALKQEQKKHAVVLDELNHLREIKEIAERRAQEAEDQLIKEQDRALKKEQELLEKISDMTEANQTMGLQMLNLEEENKKHKEIAVHNEQLQIEIQKSIEAVELLVKEKEAQKAEAAEREMKFQNSQQKLEKDVCAQMERKIADQASEFYSMMEKSLEEAAACHVKQVEELKAKHQQDLGQQAQELSAELVTVERHYQRQLKELQKRLQILTTENSLLKESQVGLESQRMEVLNKLQAVMQLQWNETISLLADTSQEKRATSSMLSHQDSHHPALDKITPTTNCSTRLSMTQLVLSQANDKVNPQDISSSWHAPSASPAALEVREDLHATPGVGDSLEKCDDFNTLSTKENKLQLSESLPVSHHTSPAFVTPKCGSQQSHCHKPPDFHIQSEVNNGIVNLICYKQTGTISRGSHKEQPRHRYHTLSMESPQKPTLQYRSDSSHSSVKSGSELPPVSRNSHILKGNYSVEGVATSHQLTGFKPNYSPLMSQLQPILCASLVNDVTRSLDDHTERSMTDLLLPNDGSTVSSDSDNSV